MKYAQLVIGLLAGTALGGSVVAATGTGAAAPMDKEALKAIVREVIAAEPKLIIESVQKYQIDQQKKQQQSANDSLKDRETFNEVYNNPDAASTGPAGSPHTVVEFFDYDCPACKMTFKSIEAFLAKDKTAHVIFREYPIFGPTSDMNAKLGLAVNRLYTEKYFAFHEKMMAGPGHDASEQKTLAIIKDLGMDTAKIKAESQKKEVWDVVLANRKLGDKLHIQGTPTLVIGTEIIPHGLSAEDLMEKVNNAHTTPPSGDSKAETKEKGPDASPATDDTATPGNSEK